MIHINNLTVNFYFNDVLALHSFFMSAENHYSIKYCFGKLKQPKSYNFGCSFVLKFFKVCKSLK